MNAHRALAASALVALLLVAGCGGGPQQDGNNSGVVSGVSRSDNTGYTGILLPEPYVVPDVSLASSKGGSYSLQKDTAGKLTLVFFGYTNCPDVCQVVMGTIASSYARLSTAEKAKVKVVFVTTDPQRDTTKVLRSYLARLNPSFIGLTGKIAHLDAAGKPMGVFIKKGATLPSGGYDVSHSTTVIAVDGRGKAPLVWSSTTSPAQMTADIHKMMATGLA